MTSNSNSSATKGLPILVVCGATGQQGKSIVDYAIERQRAGSPSVHIRAIVRDTEAEQAKAYRSAGIELFHLPNGLEDTATVAKALQDADVVFLYTIAFSKGKAFDEYKLGKGVVDVIADIQKQSGSKSPYLLYSTGPPAHEISKGKYAIPEYDDKAKLNEYIKSQAIPATFVRLGMFLENFANFHWLGWDKEEKRFTLKVPVAPTNVQLRVTSIGHDLGRATLALTDIVLNGTEEQRRRIYHNEVDFSLSYLSIEQMAQTLSKVFQTPVEPGTFSAEEIAHFMPSGPADQLTTLFHFIHHHDSIGPDYKPYKEATLPQPILQEQHVEFDTVEQFARRELLSHADQLKQQSEE